MDSFEGRLVFLAYAVTNGHIEDFVTHAKIDLGWWQDFINQAPHEEAAKRQILINDINPQCPPRLMFWLIDGTFMLPLEAMISEYRASIRGIPSRELALKT
jgi:hypothetical protein